MKRQSISKLARCRLLAGIPLALLALPAAAQVRATGDQVLTNDQRTQGTIRADVAGSRVAVLVRDSAESHIALDDNELRAAVTGNLGAFELSSDRAGSFEGSPSLAADTDGVDAHAEQVIASRQRLGSGDVSSETAGAAVRLDAANLSASDLSLRDNATATIARGNSSDATIKGRDFGSAGIAIRQETGSGSRVLATTAGGFEVAGGDLGSSRLDLAGNRTEAIARGNGTRNRLDASGVVFGGASDAGSLSDDEQAHLRAPAAILTDQDLAGSVWARAGGTHDTPAFSVEAADVTSGSIVVAVNALVADAQGNSASNQLALASPVLDHAPSEGGRASGSLAGILNAQRADGASVGAGTTGGVAVRVRRLDTATVGVDDNETQASAVRNIASNALVVRGTLVEAEPGAASERAGDIRTSGALTLQNVQDYGAGPRGYATVSAPAAAISVGGPVRDAQLRASGNGATATVAGNEAANKMAIDATTLSAGVALHSVQYGSGSLAAFNGTAPEPAGIRIELGGSVDRSTLDLSSNRDLARASANHGANELVVSAVRIEGGGEATSTATRGTADLLIESDQQLGAAGLPVPQILAYGATRIGAEVAGPVSDSRLVIADNEASAEASGNSVSNRLAVGGAHADRAGLLLATQQYGNAELVSHSQVAIAMPGSLTRSSLLVDANRNTAVASMNSAENLLVAEGSEENAGAPALGGGFGQSVSASQLLVNRQAARGGIDANARTMLEIAGSASLGGTHWSFTDNQVRAEAVANRAINTLAGAGIAGGGLVSEQQSSASVTATSAITLHRSATPGTAAASSDIDVTGNRAEAIARGNVADNLIESSDRAGSVALRNSQANSGSIYAAANGAGFASPLNGTAPASDTRLAIRANAIVADAAGNMAVSRIAQAVPGQAPVTVMSMQVNSGDVRASAVGAGAFAPLGSLQGAVLQLSGNSISANAVGNQAASVITGLR